MKFKEFCLEIQRTLPNLDDHYEIPNIIPEECKLPQSLLDRIHMDLGMCSELNELMNAISKNDIINITEELCDILWYVGNSMFISLKSNRIGQEQYSIDLKYEFGLTYQVTDGSKLTTTNGVFKDMLCIIYNVSKLQDQTKKYLAYEKPEVVYDYCKNIHYLLGAINNLAYNLKINLEEGMDKNIAKLKSRYSNKFNLEEAVNRDLPKERAILEKGAGDDYPVIKEYFDPPKEINKGNSIKEIEDMNPHLENEGRVFRAMEGGTDGG